MDYYEELGIEPTATDEDIRRAHRRLTKLLHPDQQTDEGIKQLAETQMRRLNSIVEVLYDPERRKEYDEHLQEGLVPVNPGAVRARPPQKSVFRSLPWWIASTAGAVILSLGAVWFWADNWGSSFGNHTPTYIPSEATAEQAPINPGRKQDPSVPATEVQERATSRTVATIPAPPPITENPVARSGTPRPETSMRRTLKLENTNVSARARLVNLEVPPPPNVSAPTPGTAAAIPVATIPPVNAPVSAPPASASVPAPPQTKGGHANALEGEWVYAPTEPEQRKAGFYPPEFIDLKLVSNQGGLRGQYRARYHVTDRPISPDVAFTLTPNVGPNNFLWESSNGSKGTLKVSSINADSIRIEWHTTVYSRGPALTAGTATLVRRNP